MCEDTVIETGEEVVEEVVETYEVLECCEELETAKDELEVLWTEFLKDHRKYVEKGNKAAGMRARTNSVALRKALKAYREANLAVKF